MTQNGLLIDYEFCFGCHTCEMACKTDKHLEKGQFGIKLTQIGPHETEPDRWEYSFIPVPTELCDLCEERVNAGKKPICVHHCEALVMDFGPIDELINKMDKPKMVLWTPTK